MSSEDPIQGLRGALREAREQGANYVEIFANLPGKEWICKHCWYPEKVTGEDHFIFMGIPVEHDYESSHLDDAVIRVRWRVV